jgi:5-methylcytosine-specific restriction endonuclease McrA
MTRPRLVALKPRLASNMQAQRTTIVEAGSWRSGKKGAHGRGYDAAWMRVRSAHLAKCPHCVYCLRKLGIAHLTANEVVLWCAARGIREPVATIGDHITPHRGDTSLRLDPANVQSLCKPCHDRDKAQEERRMGYR